MSSWSSPEVSKTDRTAPGGQITASDFEWLAEPCLGAEQHPQARGIEDLHVRQVDPDLGGAGGDGAVDGGAQGVGGRDVQLSRDGEDGAVTDPHLAYVDRRCTVSDVQLARLRNHDDQGYRAPGTIGPARDLTASRGDLRRSA